MAKPAVSLDNLIIEDVATLKARHGDLERRLAELDRHRSLTSAEQVERIQIKKEKLRLKDRLVALGVSS